MAFNGDETSLKFWKLYSSHETQSPFLSSECTESARRAYSFLNVSVGEGESVIMIKYMKA